MLDNFTDINPGIVITKSDQGFTQLKTIAQTNKIYSEVKVDDVFEYPVALGKIATLLSVIKSMGDNYDIVFKETYMIVSDGKNKVKIVYANPITVFHPPSILKRPETEVTFALPQAAVENVLSMARAMELKDLKFKTNSKNEVVMVTHNAGNPDSNTYEYVLEELTSPTELDIAIATDTLKMVSGDYVVSIAQNRKFLVLDHAVDTSLTYIIAATLS